MIGKLLQTGLGISALIAIAACSGQSSPQATGEALAGQAAEAAIDPRAGQVVGEREGHGDHEAYSPKAIASLGGKFELIEATRGAPFTEADLLGEWALVYFGYIECLEACPIALQSMPAAVDTLRSEGICAKPVFVDINAPLLDYPPAGLLPGGTHACPHFNPSSHPPQQGAGRCGGGRAVFL